MKTSMMRLLAIGLSLAWTIGPAAKAAAPARPNIIFILADDLGIPALGCTGGVYKTPNLDSLAAGGTRFENCFSAPLCGPSRALLMTGRYAFRTGVRDNGLGAQATPAKDGCVALRLKQAGYATAVAGKWRQLSHFTTQEDGRKWGFDEFLIWGAGAPDEDDPKAAKKRTQQAANKGSRYWDPGYNLNGKMISDAEGKYGPDVLNAFVIDFVERHKDHPFFVYYPTPLIHGPILPTPDSKQGEAAQRRAKAVENVGQGSLYADNIEYLDKLIGQLVAKLDALNLREKTLVVFTSDNGSVPIGTVGGKPIDGKKGSVLEGGSRVPLIANWPGTTPAGLVRKDLVDFSDMLPTFAELAGCRPVENLTIDGRSFAPQLRGETGRPREWVYVHLGDRRYVRSDRWKLTVDGELFDMRDAPHCQIPVPADAADSQAKAARQSLQAALDGLLAQEPSDAATPKKCAKKKAASASGS